MQGLVKSPEVQGKSNLTLRGLQKNMVTVLTRAGVIERMSFSDRHY